MRFAKTLATVAIGFAALALPATGAFAATTGGGHGQYQPGGNNYNQDGYNNKGGDGNKCRPNEGPVKVTADLFPIGGNNNCYPKPQPKPDPRSCNWGWDTTYNYGDTGRLIKHVTYGPENWNSKDNRCEFPVVYYPKPQPRPELVCHSQWISWETPTYGDWLLLEGGPFLHNGETVKFEGQSWTVDDWAPIGTPGANGSQGPGNYFVLRNHYGQTLESTGTPAHHAAFLHEFGTVKVCSWVYPRGYDNHGTRI